MYKKLLFFLLLFVLIISSVVACDETSPAVVDDDPPIDINVTDSNGDIVNIDGDTGDIVTIDHAHYEIHSGDSYDVAGVVDLPINNVLDVTITTGANIFDHHIFAVDVESETEFYIYRNVTINTPGTIATSYNMDHNSANTADSIVRTITNADVADANADTAVAAADLILHHIIGAGNDAGTRIHSEEYILRQSEDYTFRFVANAAGYVNYHIHWYELD